MLGIILRNEEGKYKNEEGSREEFSLVSSSFLWLLANLGIPWLVTASLQPLSPSSHLLIRAPVIGFQAP